MGRGVAVVALRPLRPRRAGGPGNFGTPGLRLAGASAAQAGTPYAAPRGATRRGGATSSTSILMRLHWGR